MAGSALETALELWLETPRRALDTVFPPVLEAVFARETASSRIQALRVATVIGIVAGALTAPALWLLMPDAHGAVLRIWCGLALPVGVISYLILLMGLPIRWQERQTFLSGSLVALAYGFVLTSSHRELPALYFGGISLLVMLDVVGAGFRFRMALAYAALLTAMFGVVVQGMALLHGLSGLVLLLLMSTCSSFAVFAAWRVETEARRSYALMLRERLKQEALRRQNSELGNLALRDPLTGLANRRAYEQWKSATWTGCQAARPAMGLLVLDIDNFKLYNDAFGHAAGDRCLQLVGQCIGEQLRGTTDMVARIGGEEFAVLLPGAGLERVVCVAQRLRRAVEAIGLPHAEGAAHPVVTISCGAGSSEAGAEQTAEQLFAETDLALYAAKSDGRNSVRPTRLLPARSTTDPTSVDGLRYPLEMIEDRAARAV